LKPWFQLLREKTRDRTVNYGLVVTEFFNCHSTNHPSKVKNVFFNRFYLFNIFIYVQF